jgi:2-oxoacid:acceptor oxidoreductase gamma subunit (pyruvate/2-ketoisovalerate family)
MEKDTIEIRWHGRGGQGAITAAKIVAGAAFESGYRGVVMAPTFGTERRGAPVFTSLKLSKQKIYDLSPIQQPDILVILDYLLIDEPGTLSGLKPGGLIVVNSPKPPHAHAVKGMRVAAADVTELAAGVGLKTGIVNSGIIGSFAKATGLLGIDLLAEKIESEFKGKKSRLNAEAARLCYEKTTMGDE